MYDTTEMPPIVNAVSATVDGRNNEPNDTEFFGFSGMEGGRFFEEFVTLKKENRSLKLQVREII